MKYQKHLIDLGAVFYIMQPVHPSFDQPTTRLKQSIRII